MSLLGDDRAQSVQVGAVLLFGILIVFLAIWQAQVIPTETNQAEIQHSDTVQSQLTDIRNSIVSTTTTGVKSERVNIGLRYSSRVLFVNPPPSDGTLRTVGTDETQVTIENATADGEGGAIDSVWDGSDRSYDSGFLQYTPSYNQYSTAPTTRYEHSVLYNEFTDAQLPITGQQLIDGDQITLVTVQGSYQRSAAGSEPVDMSVTSASSNRVSIRGDGEPIVLRLPTELNESVWEELFEDELASGHVESVTVDDQTLKLALNESKSYDLRMANVRFGSDREATKEPEYITAISGDGASVPKQSNLRLVAEVRDRFNNPVSGVPVTADPTQGSVAEPTRRSDSNGQVRFRYTASETAGEDTISLNAPDAATDVVPETMTVNVLEEGAAPQIDPLQFGQNEWNEATPENRVVHDGATVPWRHRADRVELGYPRDETWDTPKPVGYWPLDERIGTRVYNLAPDTPASDGRFRDNTENPQISDVRSRGILVPQASNRERGAYDFASEDGRYIDIDPTDTIGGSFSLSLWAHLDDTSDDSLIFLGRGEGSGDTLELTANGDEVQATLAGETATADISSSQWNHIFVVYDEEEMQVYVNGESGGQVDVSGATVNGFESILVGGVENQPDRTVPGKLSEVRLYDISQTETEVQNLYQVITDGYLLTDQKSSEVPLDLDSVQLTDVDARFPQGDDTEISVDVIAETTDGAIRVGNAILTEPNTQTYDLTWNDSVEDKVAQEFRLNITLSTENPEATASFVTGRIDGNTTDRTGDLRGNVSFDDVDGSTRSIQDATVTVGDNVATTSTNSSGEYAFSNLFIGTYEVTAEQSGFTTGNTTVEIEEDSKTPGNITLEPQYGIVEGSVVDQDGDPIEGATITSEVLERETTTDADGEYRLENVLAVQQDFTADADGFSSQRQLTTISEDSTVTLDFSLTENVREISGTVFDSSTDDPIDGATVTIEETGQTRTTAEDGTYSFENAPQQQLTLTAEADGYVAETTETAGDDSADLPNFDFNLEQNIGQFNGTIADADDEFALEAETTITATRVSDDETFSTTVTPGDGDDPGTEYPYELSVEPGEYTIVAEADGYEDDTFEGTVDIEAGDNITGVDFEMVALPGEIEGRVVDRDSGDGIGDATVTIEELGLSVDAEPSNLAGDFVFEEVPRGTYAVTADAPEYQPRSEEVQVGPGQTVEQNFPLEGPPNAIIASNAVLDSNDRLERSFEVTNSSGQVFAFTINLDDDEGGVIELDIGNNEDTDATLILTDSSVDEIQTSSGVNLLDSSTYQTDNGIRIPPTDYDPDPDNDDDLEALLSSIIESLDGDTTTTDPDQIRIELAVR